jgi:Calcineurin-like phosphoesterase.
MSENISRRRFVRNIASAGALVAVSQLPSFASEASAGDTADVFPERGRFERLSVSFAVVKIGLEAPFSVLHISDTHLTDAYASENEKKQTLKEGRTKTFGGHQEEALRDSIAWAKQHVDYIVHTGDLIDWQSEANFDLVKKYFGDAMTGSMGNHEFSTDMWLSDPKETRDEDYKDNTRALVQEAYPFNVRFQSTIMNGVNFITLDDVYGYVTRDQVALFKEEVKKGLPIVLCMHVPFFTDDIWRVTMRFWRDKGPYRNADIPEPSGDYLNQKEDPVTRDFISYLKTEPLLKAILAGHEHVTFEDRFSPTCMQYLVASNFLFHAREVLFI